MHTRMHTARSDADLSPFRGITYISEIRFGFIGFAVVTLRHGSTVEPIHLAPLGHFKILYHG